MHHLAILKKSWQLIPKILVGEKTIESRWYQTKRAPWNKAAVGDTIFFKNSGEPVIAQATVAEVMQFEIRNLAEAEKIVKKYGQEICLIDRDPAAWDKLPKYCVLLRLQNPQAVKPFLINKKGFGNAAAWLCAEDIGKLKV